MWSTRVHLWFLSATSGWSTCAVIASGLACSYRGHPSGTGGTSMDEAAAFLDHVIPRLRDEVVALENGDAGPRKSLWSHHDPVTLFGAEASAPAGSRSSRSSIAWPRAFPRVSPAPTTCWGPVSVAISDTWQPSNDPWLGHTAHPRKPSRSGSRRSSVANRATGKSPIATATRTTSRHAKRSVAEGNKE